MSHRFALKRFLGLTDDEMAENERMWAEEQGQGSPTHTDAAGELRSAGLSAGGIAGDMNDESDLTAPEDMTSEGSPDQGGAPGEGPGGAAAQAPTAPPPSA